MPEWAVQAKAALAQGPTALVTILATEGSAPRGAGTRMVVTPDAQHGTIGGGALEYRAVDQARAILSHPAGTWRVQDYPLGPLLGQCCGGRVRLLVERVTDVGWATGNRTLAILHDDHITRSPYPGEGRGPDSARSAECATAHDSLVGLDPRLRRGTATTLQARGPLPTPGTRYIEPADIARRALHLYGAGHVGRAIAERLPGLPFTLAWFDPRANHDAPGVTIDTEDALVACARTAPADAAILILTHDHALDYRLAAAALASPARFVGLIGSQTKRARFLSRLAADGIDATRLTCPIGTPGIPGKDPAIIAIATLAQLLSL